MNLMLLFLLLPLVMVQALPVYKEFLPMDCEDIYNNGSIHNGVYTIYIAGADKPVQVFCDMGCAEDGTHKDGLWTVIQRRMDGSVNFYRPWDAYKNGFGSADGEYWLGLENLFLMTYRQRYELRVDLEDFEKGSAYAQYTSFFVDAESSLYQLHVSGFINGGAGDSLYYHNGVNFATFDKDYYGCADANSGGFWYNYCHLANVNGLYKRGNSAAYTGIIWASWRGPSYSLKTAVMKIRRLTLEDMTN